MKELFNRHIAHTSEHPIGLEIDYAEGPFICTTDGRQYIDFISGIAVSSLGHRHPEVIRAIEEQISRHLHVMVYGEFIQKSQSEFAGLLTSLLPENLDRIYFVNSGTEANEAALKLARKHTGRKAFIAFNNSYHGDTMGSLSVTGRDVYRDPYLPLLSDVHFFDFNDSSVLKDISNETAAVIMEPIQGEGGIIPANTDWLTSVRKKCSETGTLLIFDEIQSGFGRTGKLFGFEHFDVIPDILTMAKAMGGGLPIGGLASSSEIFEAFKHNPPLNHVTTFGGHPVSCASGHAALKVLTNSNLMSNAANIEQKIRASLNIDGVVEIRGKGAMLGLELEDKNLTEKMVIGAMNDGLILGWTLHSNTLVRLAPPLIMDEKTLDRAIEIVISNMK